MYCWQNVSTSCWERIRSTLSTASCEVSGSVWRATALIVRSFKGLRCEDGHAHTVRVRVVVVPDTPAVRASAIVSGPGGEVAVLFDPLVAGDAPLREVGDRVGVEGASTVAGGPGPGHVLDAA